MRVRLVRTALTVAVVLTAVLLAGPAQGGGPTSALLSIPGAGQTASLYYTDPEYDELARLVGMTEGGGTAGEESPAGHETGPGVTVTWLVHDVTPWRIDRIYLGGGDGPWISTQTNAGGLIWEAPVLWHQPAESGRLAKLLRGLGLGTNAASDESFDGVAGAPAGASGETSPAPRTATDHSGAPDATPWYASTGWALAGLLVGTVAGAALALGWSRRRRDASDDDASALKPATAPESAAAGPEGAAEVLVR